MKRLIPIVPVILALAVPSGAGASPNDVAGRAFARALKIIQKDREVSGAAMQRCFRGHRGYECPFAFALTYADGEVKACVGSIVVRHHHARFRTGIACG